MSSSTPSTVNLNQEVVTALRVVLPVIYCIVAILGIIGNVIVLQIICANRFRHKSIHLLVCSLLFADLFFIIIFTVVRSVSYGYSDTKWFINPTEWCKAEMYLLRIFDFVLAYSVVFLCLDRAVNANSCWFGIRKFRSGISIVISIWIASAYILIPILLFKQDLAYQSYGGFLCYSTDESVPLFWLGTFPRRILDFIDIVFRILFPVFLMLVLLIIAFCSLSYSIEKANRSLLYSSDTLQIASNTHTNLIGDVSNHPKRLFGMAFTYAFVFILCQLPFEIYRCVMLWNSDIESDISYQKKNYDFAIEIPLLFLKLLNRCLNPFIFMCLADVNAFRRGCCRLWCLPCIPGCIGCKKCWCYDCWNTACFEVNHCFGKENKSVEEEWVPTGLQTISTYQYRDGDRLVTKQRVVEEFETGIEPYYKNPRLRERIEEANISTNLNGVVNETYENDDSSRLASFRVQKVQRIEDNPNSRRAKL